MLYFAIYSLKGENTVKRKYTMMSFFSGVGGIELGFEQTQGFETIFANEIDKDAALTYSSNFDHNLVVEDIRQLDMDIIPEADLLLAGFPCQAFSVAGYRKGFEDDRGNVFFDVLNIIQEKRPRVVFLENVKNLVTHDKGNTYQIIKQSLEDNGYQIIDKVLNAKDYGNVPQNRERIYIVAFRDAEDAEGFSFPEEIPLKKSIQHILERTDNKKYFYTDRFKMYDQLLEAMTKEDTAYQWRRRYVRENKSNVFPTLTANMGTGGHNVPLVKVSEGIRKLTPRECFRAQGFPDNFKLPDITDSKLYKQAGNSVVVPVVKRIAENILEAIKYNDSVPA
jgi:DNA (cytosine-5)-methyltransferase 1